MEIKSDMLLEEKMIVPFGDLMITIKWSVNEEVDTESALNIDYSNIIGELITWSVYLNRMGIMKAEAEDAFRRAGVMSKVKIAQHTKVIRANIGKATEKQIENELHGSQAYYDAKMELFDAEKRVGIMDSIYWAAQSKSKKLEALSAKIKPEEFTSNILEGKLNGIMIRYDKKLI
jgi:hypothetical protein